MNTRRGVTAAVAVTAALVVTLTACSSSGTSGGHVGPGKQKVVFWEFQTDQPSLDAWHQTISSFEKQNPNITIDLQIVPWSTQQQKLTTAIATGGLPDVSMLGNDVVAQYAKQGSLAQLDKYLPQWSQQEGHDVSADYWPGDKLYYNLDGHWYGAPITEETRMVYYRADLFQRAGLDPSSPPTTWDQMAVDAKKLAGVTKIPWAAPMNKDYVTVQTFMSVYLGYGASMLNSSGKCGFDTGQFRQALTYYTDIYKQHLTTSDATTSTNIDDLFTTGKAGMLIDGPWVYDTLAQQNPALLKSVRIAGIPAGPAGQFGFLGGWPLVMWKTSHHQDAAAKWIGYVSSPKGGLNTIAKVSGLLPGRKSLSTSTPWTTVPNAAFIKQLDRSFPYQYPHQEIPQMGSIETETIQDAVQRVASGGQNVDQSTRQLCQEINSLLGQ